MLNSACTSDSESDCQLELNLPIRKKPIRKLKISTSNQTKYKPHLSISIPCSPRMEVYNKTKCKGLIKGFNDISESGEFYTAIMKKGSYRRFNEDRVSYLCNL